MFFITNRLKCCKERKNIKCDPSLQKLHSINFSNQKTYKKLHRLTDHNQMNKIKKTHKRLRQLKIRNFNYPKDLEIERNLTQIFKR